MKSKQARIKTPKKAKAQAKRPAYQNLRLPVEKRVADLVSRLTLAEKIAQMGHAAPAIERLGIPAYNWWNECLHGVARAGIATVFPQAIGLASTWNVSLMKRIATAISDEARAKHHEAARQDIRDIYTGLTFWTPNINIFRDPRWGRGQETYGEDPYLTSRLGVAFIKGLQGNHPRYLKTVATPKHFAVHSGPENERHRFDAQANERDLRETYLPAFQACVEEGQAVSVMGAYNRTNGEPCCASPTLLEKILRQEWGFEGYVVSDCGAIDDIYKYHQVVPTPEAAAALAVNAGCDLNCGETYSALLKAVEQGLISEQTIDQSVTRLFTARFRLGMFDPPEKVPYAQTPYSVNDSPKHRALALRAARESIILLKNENDFLPLSKNLKSIAVIGPNADNVPVLLANYNGTPSEAVTPLVGIKRKVSSSTQVTYAQGCSIAKTSQAGFAEAVALAQAADVIIVCIGLSQRVEGEEGQEEGVETGEVSTGDRTDLNLPGVQEALLQALQATGKPLVVVLINGSAVAINWANEHAPAILEAWYPGEEGGTAIADVLFGDYNPGGRLPVTFYTSVDQLPPFDDYRMAGRTYRYLKVEPLFRFGYGLSYTQFKYRRLQVKPKKIKPGQRVQVSVEVQNTGRCAGDEVVQFYVSDVAASVPVPLHQLQGFERIHLAPGEKKTVSCTLKPKQMSLINAQEKRVVEPGEFRVTAGGSQPSPSNADVLADSFEVRGETVEIN
jgi:beta-glucosidase